MSRYIDADELKQQRPEYLDEENDNRDRAEHAKGWNACNKYWIDILREMPAAEARYWIPVDKRLPEYDGSYLVCTEKSEAFITHYYAQSKSFTGGGGHITYWMDRPEPPKINIRDIEFVKEQERKREESRKAYQHDYYMRVTKPKRQAAKMERGGEE